MFGVEHSMDGHIFSIFLNLSGFGSGLGYTGLSYTDILTVPPNLVVEKNSMTPLFAGEHMGG